MITTDLNLVLFLLKSVLTFFLTSLIFVFNIYKFFSDQILFN